MYVMTLEYLLNVSYFQGKKNHVYVFNKLIFANVFHF